MTLFTILICCSGKKGFRRLFTFTIKALTYTYVPVGLVHFTQSASIVCNRKTQRSVVRGRGTSVTNLSSFEQKKERKQMNVDTSFVNNNKNPRGIRNIRSLKLSIEDRTYENLHVPIADKVELSRLIIDFFHDLIQSNPLSTYKLFTTTNHHNTNIVSEFKTLKVLLNQH